MKRTLINKIPETSADAFAGCGHGPAPAARRARGAAPIFVNDVAIPESAIAQEAQNHRAASGAEARAAAASALVIRELLLRRARDLNLRPEPQEDGDGRVESDEAALARQVLDLEAPAAEPSDDECRRAYDASPDRYSSPEHYEASHILFAAEANDAVASAHARARAVEAIQAIADGASFPSLARAHSDCPTANDGGALGLLCRGDLDHDLEDILLMLAPGRVAPSPVRTRFGWHVLRLDRHAPSRRLPFEMVLPAVRRMLRERARMGAAAQYIEGLAKDARIEGISLSIRRDGVE